MDVGQDEDQGIGTDRADATPTTRRHRVMAQVRRLIRAVREGDEEQVQAAIVSISQSRRYLAPLGLVVGAFVMLFEGIKLLVTNWRLMLVQVLPAMWIWAAMLDLKAHALRGHGFPGWRGPIVLAFVVLATVLTAASFYLNAVFAFAVATTGPPDLHPAFRLANLHRKVVLGWGALVGFGVGFSAFVVPRWGLGWFTLAMGIMVGILSFCYVAVPARLLGIKKSDNYSRRDKLAASAMGATIGAVVCTPSYTIGRIGVLLLGSKTFFAVGVVLLVIGLVLQAGATGSVKAIKVSAKLAAGRPVDLAPEPSA